MFPSNDVIESILVFVWETRFAHGGDEGVEPHEWSNGQWADGLKWYL